MALRRIALLLCLFGFGTAVFAQGPTYSRDVSRIYQAKCQICHRDGDVAPFSLNNYDDAVTWAFDTNRAIRRGTMPPWKPVADHGDFRDNYSLTGDEKQTILDWIANGMEQGDPADMPEPLTNTSAWGLGDPDVLLTVPQSYSPPADVTDTYRCFVLPETGFTQDTFLSAVDLRPGNRKMVHHVLIFTDTTGTAAKMDGKDGNQGYDCFGGPGIPVDPTNLLSALDALGGVAGWAPGTRPHFLPDGVGLMIPNQSRIVMQVHYHPNGIAGSDQTQVGLYLMRTDVKKRLYNIPVVNTGFKIPPATVRDVVATFPPPPFSQFMPSAKAILIFPHMHRLGRQIKADLIDKDGHVITSLIYEDNWDFNWQGSYTYKEPVAIPAGAQLKVTCTFDNTADNPKNPNNPLVTVGWGERTTDEMCIGFVGITLDNDTYTLLRTIKPAK
ncbi:MAG TPA: hypothetical protein VIX89_05310 [Bryobacteraceae bacterium]